MNRARPKASPASNKIHSMLIVPDVVMIADHHRSLHSTRFHPAIRTAVLLLLLVLVVGPGLSRATDTLPLQLSLPPVPGATAASQPAAVQPTQPIQPVQPVPAPDAPALSCTCTDAAAGAGTAGGGAATIAAAAAKRGRLRPVRWEDLKGLDSPEITSPAVWQAFRLGCQVLQNDPAWSGVCEAALALPESVTAEDQLDFLRARLQPWQAINGDGQAEGLATGYYEPVLHGSRTRDQQYRYPLYARPDDLLTVELDSLVPELKGKRLRVRIDGQRLVPYYTRADIEHHTPASLLGLEIVWVDDPVEVFFLHVQGSGRVELAEGGGIHVGYADQNGQAFKSVARQLIERGELTVAQATLQGMKAWARAHPDRIDSFLDGNPSYVFFREIGGDLPGPLGTLGVPLLGEATVAVDAKVVPLGAPVLVDTTYPLSQAPLRRLAMAQDTGGAINGAVRVDFFWGLGENALAQAGRMRQKLRLWVLLPLGMHPDGGVLLPDTVVGSASVSRRQ